jgi:hypothetical protein
MFWREPKHIFNLVRINMIGPIVIGGRRHDFDRRLFRKFPFDNLFDHLGNFHNGHVLIAAVENLVGDLFCRRVQQELAEVRVILNVQIRSQLRAAKNSYFVVCNRVVGEDIDGQVKPQTRRITTDGSRAKNDADKIFIGVSQE